MAASLVYKLSVSWDFMSDGGWPQAQQQKEFDSPLSSASVPQSEVGGLHFLYELV